MAGAPTFQLAEFQYQFRRQFGSNYNEWNLILYLYLTHFALILCFGSELKLHTAIYVTGVGEMLTRAVHNCMNETLEGCFNF